jgi:serine/threonine-protein kinase HipA
MKTNKSLQVCYNERLVGVLALGKDRRVAFEYDNNWLDEGFSISPFSLPLEKKVFLPSKDYFDGLFGAFADSLPDAWGRLLLDRVLQREGIKPGEVSVLDRLAIIGYSGMGALSYRPEQMIVNEASESDLDFLARESKRLLEAEYTKELDTLYKLGGSSGGARPKVMMEIDGIEWIIKFPAHGDDPSVGKSEYDYSVCAKECGIDMTQTRLFQSNHCAGYFGIKRFDRQKTNSENVKIHMLSAAALLELDYRQPSLDYHGLMKLTKIITKDNAHHVENMFRRACFNVFANNRDDHSKNFSFLYDEQTNRWHLSPAYDLTYSNTFYGQHTTSVDGNGKNPGSKELLQVGLTAGMNKKQCLSIIEEVREKVSNSLGLNIE